MAALEREKKLGKTGVDPKYDQEWLFSEDPTIPHKNEGWEYAYIGGFSLVTLVFFITTYYGPNTSMLLWAREEVLHSGFKAPEPAPDLED